MGIDPAKVGDFHTNAVTRTAETLGGALEAPTR
jgi:hypothetical protein